jgi:hypothetical protein
MTLNSRKCSGIPDYKGGATGGNHDLVGYVNNSSEVPESLKKKAVG